MYNNFRIISDFGDSREYGRHEGIDYLGTKNDHVRIIDNGVLYNNYVGKLSGNSLIYKHDLKGFDIQDDYYSAYFHLSEKLGEKLPCKNEIIGLFGNTGKCLTSFDISGKKTNTYRTLDPNEITSKYCNFGVHLHLSIFQFGKNTKLLEYLRKKYNIIENTDYFIEKYFYGEPEKKDIIFYNPLTFARLIYKE
jgi:murein DD-endopeptidase MepM/ murein hydrolase activator NlpD